MLVLVLLCWAGLRKLVIRMKPILLAQWCIIDWECWAIILNIIFIIGCGWRCKQLRHVICTMSRCHFIKFIVKGGKVLRSASLLLSLNVSMVLIMLAGCILIIWECLLIWLLLRWHLRISIYYEVDNSSLDNSNKNDAIFYI